ncbi:uncharacterized protein PG998_003388 [Apiospora kogelbergensis]|uniref:uncharacterized protein n=1 Tax=Apiospora kogelbergensis TaxID=1337665 RepID=UPI0031305F6B
MKGCEKELKLVEWKSWCPRARKACEAKSLRKDLPRCCDKATDKQVFDEWCRVCNSETVDKMGRPTRCGRPECFVVEPEKGTLDPQDEWEAILIHWPARYRHRYERHRDVKEPSEIKEVSQWASSFPEH